MISVDGRLIMLDEFPMGKYSKKKLLEKLQAGEGSYARSEWVTYDGLTSSVTISNAFSSTTNSIVLSEPFMESEGDDTKSKKKKDKGKLEIEFPIESFVNRLIGFTEYMRGDLITSTPSQRWEAQGDNIIVVAADDSPMDYRTYWNEVEYAFSRMDKKKDTLVTKLLKSVRAHYSRFFSKSDNLKDPVEVMQTFKEVLEVINVAEPQLARLESYIESLKTTEQDKTLKAVCSNLLIQNWENKLLSDGRFTKFITEDQAVSFIRSSERGLALDLLKDFPRIIPKDVMEKFEQADSLNVFDNYLILHYVSKSKREKRGMSQSEVDAQRKKELEKKKDPILFGVIRGSRRLYYIADWIDDDCDLTLSELLNKINSSEKSLNEHT